MSISDMYNSGTCWVKLWHILGLLREYKYF